MISLKTSIIYRKMINKVMGQSS